MSKTDYHKIAEEIITNVGGLENIISATHCATRVRLVLKDSSKVKEEKLKQVATVVGVNPTAQQYQIIIGNEVAAVYKEIIACGVSEDNSTKEQTKNDDSGKKEGVFQRIIEAITGCMTPMIPALTAAGMMKVVLSLISQFHWMNTDSSTYQLLTVIGDAAFYFMPLVVSVFAARKFKVNTSLAVIVAAILIHPSFVAMVTDGKALNFFGIPVAPVSYSYSIIPVILIVWLMSYIEKGVDRITPNVLKIILNPTLVLLISAPLALIIIGPLGYYAGDWLASGIKFLEGTLGFILVPILAAAMPFIVMTGMHHALTPIFLSTFALTGYDSLILLAQVCANLAQGGASLAVGFRSKNNEMKQLATASGISALMGITEPAIYGVTLKLKKPMIAAVIGAGVAGLFAGIMNVKIYVLNNSILTALAMADGTSNLVNGIIMLLLSIVIPFILVLVMGTNESVNEK